MFFPGSAAVCTLLNETDRYTAAPAKVHSTAGQGVRRAIFHHLILSLFGCEGCIGMQDGKHNSGPAVLLHSSKAESQTMVILPPFLKKKHLSLSAVFFINASCEYDCLVLQI